MFHHFVWKRQPDGKIVGVNHSGTERKRRQDLSPEYLEVGAVYGFDTQGFIKAGFRFFGKIGFYEIPMSRALEIDTEEDWKMADVLIQSLKEK